MSGAVGYVGTSTVDTSIFCGCPRSGWSRRPSAVSRLPQKRQKGLPHGHRSDVTMYRQTNQEFATKYMGWFFLMQAAPLPEHLIGVDPQYYLEYNPSVLNKTPGALRPENIEGVSSLLHVDDSCHVRGFQSVCGHRSWRWTKRMTVRATRSWHRFTPSGNRTAVVGRPCDLQGESELNGYGAQS